MTTYPSPTDPVDALSRAAGSPETHSTDHGRVINQWENILHYGADPTGATDSSAAIQAASDTLYRLSYNGSYTGSGDGAVYVPQGWFRANSSITMRAGTSIIGSGAGSVIMPYMGSDPVIKQDTNQSTSPGPLLIRDLTIGQPLDTTHASVPTPTGTGDGIYLNYTSGGATGCRIDNVIFSNLQGSSSWAVSNNNHLETIITGCAVKACAGGGFSFTNNSNASVVRDCQLSNSALGSASLGGIYCDASGLTISGTVVEAWAGYGIKVVGDGGTKIWMDGVWLEDNHGDSLNLLSVEAHLVGSYFAPNAAGRGLVIDQSAASTGQTTRLTAINCEFTTTAAPVLKDNASTPTAIQATFIGCSGAGMNSLDLTNVTAGASTVYSLGGRRDTITAGSGAAVGMLDILKGEIRLGTGSDPLRFLTGAGTPEASIQAPVGSLYLRTNGGTSTTLYVKQAGAGLSTGWAPVHAAAPSSAYTVTNPTTDRALNVTADTLPQVAEVLGTLIADLQTAGLLA